MGVYQLRLLQNPGKLRLRGEVLKWKSFADWNKWNKQTNKKPAEALKGIQIDEFKNCSEQWEKRLNRCTASNGEDFEDDWSLNMEE